MKIEWGEILKELRGFSVRYWFLQTKWFLSILDVTSNCNSVSYEFKFQPLEIWTWNCWKSEINHWFIYFLTSLITCPNRKSEINPIGLAHRTIMWCSSTWPTNVSPAPYNTCHVHQHMHSPADEFPYKALHVKFPHVIHAERTVGVFLYSSFPYGTKSSLK